MKNDFQILDNKEHSVYPGHPIVIAYLITENFDSLDDAESREGRVFPAALESCYIPGAGGNVYAGLDFLRECRRTSFDEAAERADAWWSRCDSQAKGGYPTPGHKHDPTKTIRRWKKGQAQANRYKDRLKQKLQTWKC